MCGHVSGRAKAILLLFVLLLVLTACGGNANGGLAGSCAHLRCLPEEGVGGVVEALLADAADGAVIDEGESRIGDALLRAAAALQQWSD